MNIKKFIESLNEDEIREIATYIYPSSRKITIKEFLKRNDISVRLRNVLNTIIEYGHLEYIDDINSNNFFQYRNAGKKSFNELQNIITTL